MLRSCCRAGQRFCPSSLLMPKLRCWRLLEGRSVCLSNPCLPNLNAFLLHEPFIFLVQGLLTDAALAVLVDSSWTSLDISESCVTDTGLQTALQTTPHLLSLDLTGCIVSQQTVRSLGSWCTQLQVLRIGCTNILDDHVWAVSMKHIMPTVVQTVDTTDSWEALLSPSEQSGSIRASTSQATIVEQTASKVVSYSRLSQLTKLIWPRILVKTAEMLARKFPRILVNPQAGSCSSSADPATALDEAAMRNVAPFWEQEQVLSAG
ncbi:TPA: hypothetical protein ACH3X1_005568 [Trebouxia sp. C0004]